jgi:hypothetical protein
MGKNLPNLVKKLHKKTLPVLKDYGEPSNITVFAIIQSLAVLTCIREQSTGFAFPIKSADICLFTTGHWMGLTAVNITCSQRLPDSSMKVKRWTVYY